MFNFYVSDIDECSRSTADCVALSNCSNTNGSYVCVCIDGYEWNSDNTNCQGCLSRNHFIHNYLCTSKFGLIDVMSVPLQS